MISADKFVLEFLICCNSSSNAAIFLLKIIFYSAVFFSFSLRSYCCFLAVYSSWLFKDLMVNLRVSFSFSTSMSFLLI